MAVQRLVRSFAALLAALLSLAIPARADQATSLAAFVVALWPDAEAAGIRRATFDAAFAGLTADPKVIAQTRSQPEFSQSMGEYIRARVNDKRVAAGRELARIWKTSLDGIETTYGVDRYTVLAVWGLESNFGTASGNSNIIRSLATLACCTNRQPDFFRAELITALQILEAHDTDPRHMTGSWAGAMGQTQFMPSSFMTYAVDGNGDGHRDIWNTAADALASTANYLARHDWEAMKTWGYEVTLPADFDFAAIDHNAGKPVADWLKSGIRRTGDKAFPATTDAAWLRLPAGARGPAFLILRNFLTLKAYNNSDAYALSVGHLADRIRGGDGFAAVWPAETPLSRTQGEALQRKLKALGYSIDKIDGKVGETTRTAMRAWQRSMGLLADGYPSVTQLRQMGVSK